MRTPRLSQRALRPRNAESGAVLVVVMLVMLGLLGLGMTALWLTSGNMQVGANVNLRTNALYVAEAGIERAREFLNDPAIPPDVNDLLNGCGLGNLAPNCPDAANGGPREVVPTAINADGTPNGVGAIMFVQGGALLEGVAYPPANFARDPGVPGAPIMAQNMGTYTVWIRNDMAELRQELYTVDGNRTVVVRSEGVAADGRTSVVLEVTLGPSPAASANPNNPGPPPPVLCNSGKNACDDNSSTQYGIVVN